MSIQTIFNNNATHNYQPCDPASSTSPDQLHFEPGGIYYDGPSGKYLVDAGDYFRTYGRKSPVSTGLERYYRSQGCDPKEAVLLARDSIADAEVDRHVEWSGNLAGHRKGLIHSVNGKPMLVLSSPAIVDPEPGPAPVVSDLIRQAFPDQVQRDVFVGWLAGSYRSVRAGIHHPAPMMCLAGAPNCGKSLLALIVKLTLGGRSANPHSAWFGSLPWNDDLFGAELLLLDDSQGSTDIRSRMNFSQSFKEAIYSGNVSLRKRHCSTMVCRPAWRVMVCCNDNAESLLILPPIGTDNQDKVTLLKMSVIRTPVDTDSPEGRELMERMILAELPQLAAHLVSFEIPMGLRDSRSGIRAWRHPDLTQAIESTKPEARLEELLGTAMKCYLWDDLPKVMTSSEVEARLIDRDSPVRDQAKAILGTWSMACGTYLGRLADGHSQLVKSADFDAKRKVRRFYLVRSSGG